MISLIYCRHIPGGLSGGSGACSMTVMVVVVPLGVVLFGTLVLWRCVFGAACDPCLHRSIQLVGLVGGGRHPVRVLSLLFFWR